ncbi:MAG: S8 family peptidase [Bacteroidales bacterium]|nr:S8 family peptidase [Bacteroidales bacterium]
MTFKNNITKAFRIYSSTALVFLSIILDAQSYKSDELLVKLNIQNAQQSLTFILDEIQVPYVFVNSILPNVHKQCALSSIFKIKLQDSTDFSRTLKYLQKSNIVVYVEPVYIDQVLYQPSDTRIGSQYSLSVCHAYEAWDICKGDSNIVIGVTDTGINFDHEDLRTNIFYNVNDPIDGLDNDFDGYVDNYMGWDFGSDDNNPQWNESGTSGNAIHGTFVAGLAGARTDNGKGMACFGFSNKILPIKVSNDNGYITKGYESIIYAAEHGCDIINCSWGGTTPHQFGRDVIRYVTEDLNVIVVAAAGNENNQKLYYPASYENVVSVAASNASDNKWESSSYNWRVDIIAPGEQVFSTLTNSSYSTSSGTSFASPIVASSLALLKAYYPDTLSNTQLIEILKTSGDIIDTLPANIDYQGLIGRSRLNIYRALTDNWSYAISQRSFGFLSRNGVPFAGDTASLTGKMVNYLKPLHNLHVSYSTNSPYVDWIDSTLFFSFLDEGESVDLSQEAFQLVLSSQTPYNQPITIDVNYQSDEFSCSELRTISVNFPAMDVVQGSLSTTLFSEGTIGKGYVSEGLGFGLKTGSNLLYELGFIAGISEENCLSNVAYYTDWSPLYLLDSLSTDSVWSASNVFQNQTLLPLIVKAEYEILSDEQFSNALIANYQIVNTSGANYEGLYIGLMADWDIVNSAYNFAFTDTARKMAFTQAYGQAEIAAIQLLNNYPFKHFALDNAQSTGDVTPYNGYMREEFYNLITRKQNEIGIDNGGVDVVSTLSSGPFILPINDTLELTFVLWVGTNIAQLQESADSLQAKYNQRLNSDFGVKTLSDISYKVYPIPTNNILIVEGLNVNNQIIRISDLNGKLFYSKTINSDKIEINTDSWAKGIYILEIDGKQRKLIKM